MKKVTLILLTLTITLTAGWTRTYGGSNNDCGWSVQQTADGGYIIAGQTESLGAGGSDAYLIKTDASGDTVWTRTYGGSEYDNGHSVQQTTDGGYIIVGQTASFGAGARDVYLLKTDASGDTVWTRTFGSSDYDWGGEVQQTSDGGYIIAGRISVDGYDVYLLKTDASGDTGWTRTYGGSEADWGSSVQQTTDGGYIIAGTTFSFGAGDYDIYLIKIDESGDTVWTRTYGGEDSEKGYSVQQTADGGYIIAGQTASFGAGKDDVYLIKTDASGDTVWTRTYGGSDDDWGRSVQQTTDGGYIIVGTTFSFGAGEGAVYLIKIDSLGDTTSISAVREHTPETQPGFEVVTAVGKQIVLRFAPANRSQGDCVAIFDASGRQVDEVHVPQKGGTLTWGDGFSPGVYFIRERSGNPTIHKVILVR